MRIGIDLRCLEKGRKTGVGEYAYHFLRAVLEQDEKNEYIGFANSFRRNADAWEEWKQFSNFKIKEFRWPNKLLNLLFWYFNWPKIDRMLGGADILIFPNINFAAWSPKAEAILTVHDLSFERYPETFSWKRRFWHFLINPRRMAQRAKRIIAVSDSTKIDLIRLYSISPSKIKSIHSAAHEEFKPLDRNDLALAEVKERYQLPYRFIFFLGTMEPRKNIIGLIRAYNILRGLKNSELDRYKLVIAGAHGWKYSRIISEIGRSPFYEDILLLGAVDETDLPAVFNLAGVFVYPSFFEGFGFPPLQAMQCGTPVVVSNNSSLPEIVGGAGMLVEPDKPDEIAKAVQEMIINKELREEFIERGKRQASQFSWPKAAAQFLDIIRTVKN